MPSLPLDSDDATSHTGATTRRTVAKGVAWSVPALLVAAPAVAVTASQLTPGLDGWIYGVARRNAYTTSAYGVGSTLTLTGHGHHLNRDLGLWVSPTAAGQTITGITIQIQIRRTWTPSTPLSVSGSSQHWTTPALTATSENILVYTTTYKASSVTATAGMTALTTSDFDFVFTGPEGADLSQWGIYREVYVDGKPLNNFCRRVCLPGQRVVGDNSPNPTPSQPSGTSRVSSTTDLSSTTSTTTTADDGTEEISAIN